MKATLLYRDRVLLDDDLLAEMVLWRLPTPVRGSTHPFKYRLALIDKDECVLRYDNEAGKGDHKHIGSEEVGYSFSTIQALREDFLMDAAEYQRRR
jgi:hypothetical protein